MKGVRTTCLIDNEYIHIQLDYSYKNLVQFFIQTERYYIYRLALVQMLYILLEGLQMAQISDIRQILQFFGSNFKNKFCCLTKLLNAKKNWILTRLTKLDF